MANPEQMHSREHKTSAASEAAAERSVELARKHEKDNQPENRDSHIEKARQEAAEAIIGQEPTGTEQHQGEGPAYSLDPSKASTKQKDAVYKQTMKTIQAEMSLSGRTLSKIIHNPVIERSADIAGNTIARPNAILFGSLFALISVSSIYLIAKYYGYSLSGFETIGSFIIGWMVGLLVDYIRIMASGKRQ